MQNEQFVTLGENASGEAAYVVGITEDLLWSNLPLFFEDYGFTVKDLNETNKIYYVNYVKPESSLWDSIWGDTVPVVDLPEGKYQFQLEKMAEKSLVTIYDEQGTALPEATLEKIFTVMEAGLSFKNVF